MRASKFDPVVRKVRSQLTNANPIYAHNDSCEADLLLRDISLLHGIAGIRLITALMLMIAVMLPVMRLVMWLLLPFIKNILQARCR